MKIESKPSFHKIFSENISFKNKLTYYPNNSKTLKNFNKTNSFSIKNSNLNNNNNNQNNLNNNYNNINYSPIIEKQLGNNNYLPQNNINSLRTSKSLYTVSQTTNENVIQNILNSNSNNNNNNVLSQILDSNEKYNQYTPSKLKQLNNEINSINIQNTIKELNYKENINLYLIQSIEAILSSLINNKINLNNLSIENQLYCLIEYINNDENNIKLGSLIIIYIILKKYFNNISEELLNIILSKILYTLKENYDIQEELYLTSCLNILSLFNNNIKFPLLYENINLIAMFLTDFNYPYLQRSSFVCLMNLGKLGINTLINISLNPVYYEYQNYILSNLINTPHIQKIIIVRALINELNNNNIDITRKLEVLSALNRMYDLIDENLLYKISEKFNEDNFRNYFLYIASIIRCANNETDVSENILLYHLENNNDINVKLAISRVLGCKVRRNKTYLKMFLENNNVSENKKNLPGKFFRYIGELKPILGNDDDFILNSSNNNNNNKNNSNNEENLSDLSINEDLNDNKNNIENEEYLLINIRDFLASLKRMMNLDYNHNYPQILFENNNNVNLLDAIDYTLYNNNSSIIKNFENILNPFPSNNINNKLYSDENPYKNYNNKQKTFNYLSNEITQEKIFYPISKNVIAILSKYLSFPNSNLQMECCLSLGKIGKPYSLPAFKNIYNLLLNSNNSNVKCVCLWSLGRLIEANNINIISEIIINLTNSNIWKIKKSALYAISKFGNVGYKKCINVLVKLLNSVSVNKQIIAETIISFGESGEDKLLEILNNKSNEKNYKLIQAIIKSFGFVNIKSPNIDFIIEKLFYLSDNINFLIKKNCLISINKLYNKSKEKKINIIYFNENNIIPFFYNKLKDKEIFIQNYAKNFIKNFGPKGELIFIEGLLNEKNYIVKTNCGIGLCESGVKNLRTIYNKGLNDNNKFVVDEIMKAIMKNYKINDIIDYYENNKKLLSLKITINEFLDKFYYDNDNKFKFYDNNNDNNENNYLYKNFINFNERILNEINKKLNLIENNNYYE